MIQSDAPDYRRNFQAFSPDELNAFATGLLALKKTGEYDDLVWTHAAAYPEVHLTPLFLPWHRAFLIELEGRMRRQPELEDFSVPYWDWAADTSYPRSPSTWSDDFLGNGRGIGMPVSTGKFTGPTWITVAPKPNQPGKPPEVNAWGPKLKRMLSAGEGFRANYDLIRGLFVPILEPFVHFTWTLESTVHAAMHNWVGGQMSAFEYSVNDPVFWLHHSNVERLFCMHQSLVEAPDAPSYQYFNPNTKRTMMFGPDVIMPATSSTSPCLRVRDVWDIKKNRRYIHHYLRATWPELPTSAMAPFATGQEVTLQPADDGMMYMAIVGGNNRTYLASGLGDTWNSPVPLFGDWGTHTAMSLVRFQGKHHLFLTNHAKEIFWATSPDGEHWQPTPTFRPFHTWKTDRKINAVVSPEGDYLFLTLVDELGTPHWALYNGKHWGQPMPLFGVTSAAWPTDAPVTLAYFQGQYHLVLVGRKASGQGTNLYYATSFDCMEWSAPKALPAPYTQFSNVIHPVNLQATADALFMTIVDQNKKPWFGFFDGRTWAAPEPLFQAKQKWETRLPVSISYSHANLQLIVMSGDFKVYSAISP